MHIGPSTQQDTSGGGRTLPILYSEAIALGLIHFAARDSVFASELARRMKEHPSAAAPIRIHGSAKRAMRLMLPRSLPHARVRLRSLIDERSPYALTLLKHAAKEVPYESPKAVVLGITIGVLPIGVLGHDKPKGEVTIVIRDDVAQNTDLLRCAIETSMKLFDRALSIAGKDIRKLDPDMGDWFFGGRELRFCKGTKATLERIAHDLEEIDVLHAVREDASGTALLAVGPAINSDTLTLDFELERMG